VCAHKPIGSLCAISSLIANPAHVCPRPLRYTSPSFAGTPALLPYGALAFVRSTPSLGRPCTFFALRCLGVRRERRPASMGHPLFRHMMSWRPFLGPPNLDRFSAFGASWSLRVRYEHTPSFAGTPARQYGYNTSTVIIPCSPTSLSRGGLVVRQAPEELRRPHFLFLCVKHHGGNEPSGACHGEKSH